MCSVELLAGSVPAMNNINTHMATVDHDRQGQATHRHKSRTVVEFAS